MSILVSLISMLSTFDFKTTPKPLSLVTVIFHSDTGTWGCRFDQSNILTSGFFVMLHYSSLHFVKSSLSINFHLLSHPLSGRCFEGTFEGGCLLICSLQLFKFRVEAHMTGGKKVPRTEQEHNRKELINKGCKAIQNTQLNLWIRKVWCTWFYCAWVIKTWIFISEMVKH